jgi:hypothetical protein
MVKIRGYLKETAVSIIFMRTGARSRNLNLLRERKSSVLVSAHI